MMPLTWVSSPSTLSDGQIDIADSFINHDSSKEWRPRASLSSEISPSQFITPLQYTKISDSIMDAHDPTCSESSSKTETVIFQCSTPVPSSSFFKSNASLSSESPSQACHLSSDSSQNTRSQLPSFEPFAAANVFQRPVLSALCSSAEVS